MDHLYPIGKVAKITGVSVQTLRYYSNIGLVSPSYVNPNTGYRYYSVDQLHFIDRIKYLQKFGLNLEEIQTILCQNDISFLIEKLDERKQYFQAELNKIRDIIDSIDWYKNYFSYVNPEKLDSNCYTRHIEKRYILVAKCFENEPSHAYHVRLNKIKSSPPFKDLAFNRQFSYILDFKSLMEGTLKPYYLGMFLRDKPPIDSPNVLEISEGEYLCQKARILSDGWNPYFAKLFFEGKPDPCIVLANEFEDNLQEYSRCVYEIQMLVRTSHAEESM